MKKETTGQTWTAEIDVEKVLKDDRKRLQLKGNALFFVGMIVASGLIYFGYLTLVQHPKDLDALYLEGVRVGFINGMITGEREQKARDQELFNKYQRNAEKVVAQLQAKCDK